MAKLSKRAVTVLSYLANHGRKSHYCIRREFAWPPGFTLDLLRKLVKRGLVVRQTTHSGWYVYWAVTNKGREAIGQLPLPLEET